MRTEPLVRVRSGNPDPTELAALIVVLTLFRRAAPEQQRPAQGAPNWSDQRLEYCPPCSWAQPSGAFGRST
ncbi:acyl-CoA carboxylase subunit epsilon [Gandjariella thermophila]|uniref:Acyl-CoA carboxylase subunit epsilon n=1 Tax=Gandjariella thermophila TaxID=1931992 RepID=A0A4D4JC56_9PSEU|nr:hypothetical protein GTS_36590 [Gandjariella thermophila]